MKYIQAPGNVDNPSEIRLYPKHHKISFARYTDHMLTNPS